MIIYIKNMVSLRCKLKVIAELEQLGITGADVQLGMVEFSDIPTNEQIENLREALSQCGLEVMFNKNVQLVEEIKKVIRQMIDDPFLFPNDKSIPNSEYIAGKLGKNYAYLAMAFADETGISIGQYIINHRVEHAKVLIKQNILTLSEIAFRLHYSSIGHLSNQFRQITGMAPSVYRRHTRIGLYTDVTNGSVMGHKVPYTLSRESTGARVKQDFTSKQISFSKI